MSENFLTVKETAGRLKLAECTVRRYIKAGIIKVLRFRPRGEIHIPESEVVRLLSVVSEEDL